jgi:hypothetical protein
MFKCCECEKVFSDPKITYETVPYGEGVARITLAECPHCGSGFDEVYPCKDCGEYFLADELHSFYCIDCLKENWDKVDDLFKFGKDITTANNVNQFAMDMFGGIEGVNDILRLLLKSIFSCNPQMLQAKKDKFIEDYADDLAEFWEEQHNEQP